MATSGIFHTVNIDSAKETEAFTSSGSNAITSVITTDSLSIGTTFDASSMSRIRQETVRDCF